MFLDRVQQQITLGNTENICMPARVTRGDARVGLEQTKAPRKFSANAVKHEFVANDAANDYTLQEQQDNFERAMHLADSANVPVWVSSTQPRNNLNSAQMVNLIAMRDWLLTRFGNKAIDFFTTLANPDGTINIVYDFDDVHLNDAGHAVVAQKVQASPAWAAVCPAQP